MNGWRTILGVLFVVGGTSLLWGVDPAPSKGRSSPRVTASAATTKPSKIVQAAAEIPEENEMPALPPRKSPASSGLKSGSSEKQGGGNGWTSIALSLVVVIALILSCAYAFRKQIPLASKILPAEIIEVLGKRYIDPRNSIHLIRCGSKILIVAHSPQHGMQPLSEITDPVQVDELAGRCFQSRGNSTTQRFSQLLGKQLSSEEGDEKLETPLTDEISPRGTKPRSRGGINV